MKLSLIIFRRDIGVASDAKVTSDAPNPTEPNEMAGVSFRATENPPHCPDNSTFQAQNQWLRSPLVADCAFSNEMLKEHEELAIDEGTINLSSHYSQELLTTLSQALQNSGLDLSQASISVQINLAICRVQISSLPCQNLRVLVVARKAGGSLYQKKS